MISISDKQKCCGCSACAQRCPKQCITMQEDAEGFLYPQVDADVCIDCGLCEKVCPFINPNDKRDPILTLAAINKNDAIRLQSSSGGVFTLLAEKVINEGGVVFGACFDEVWQVALHYTETLEGLAAFRGSKYLQARIGDTYNQCETFLRTGRKVLYSGTPCQVAGLKHFLHKEYDNLLAVDLVCYGVPSPKVWRMYLNEVVGVANTMGVSMREKRERWRRYNFVLDYEKDSQSYILSSFFGNNDYMKAFLRDMILRPSCYGCKVKECRSNSDITLADYWGIQNVRPVMDDDKGTGLVLIHNEKGKNALDFDQMRYEETSFEECCRSNPAIYRTAKPWYKREEFFSKLDKTDNVIFLIREILKPSMKVQLYQNIRHVVSIPQKIVRMLLSKRVGDNNKIVDKLISTESRVSLPVDHNLTIDSITFRSKEKSWKKYRMRITIK